MNDNGIGSSNRNRNIYSLLIFLLLTAIYLSNQDILQHNDTTGNIYQAVNIIENNRITFTYDKFPFMFSSDGDVKIHPNYYLAPVVNSQENNYVNRFGPGSSLLLLPSLYLSKIINPDWLDEHQHIWLLNKITAATITTATALLIFLISCIYLNKPYATLVCLIYALGTSAWSYTSQGMFQHTSCNFFLVVGLYCLLKKDTTGYTLLAAIGFALAVWSRPTCIIFVVLAGLYMLIHARRRFPAFFLLNIISALGILVYNNYFFGSFFHFPQTFGAEIIAYNKTGSADVWQTPILTGLSGILFSPARGLFVFSPVLLFAIYGLFLMLRQKQEFSPFLFFITACMIILVLDSRWFDWWGGWSFGYRIILETIPFLTLLLIPVFRHIGNMSSLYKGIFIVFFSWSVSIQAIGAFAYDVGGWDNKLAYRVKIKHSNKTYLVHEYELEQTHINPDLIESVEPLMHSIDRPGYRQRLWSLTDTPISFYIRYFRQAREEKKRSALNFLARINQP